LSTVESTRAFAASNRRLGVRMFNTGTLVKA
jgi:hypothetical protein